MLTEKIGFIGAGRMATALAKGFVASRLVACDNLLAADPSDEQAVMAPSRKVVKLSFRTEL